MWDVGGGGLLSVWDTFRSSVCRIAHVLQNSENELLAACQSVDRKSGFSNINRAEKFEREVKFDIPLGFQEGRGPVVLGSNSTWGH